MLIVQAFGFVTCRTPQGLLTRSGNVYPEHFDAQSWQRLAEQGRLPCNASIWMIPGTVE